MKYALFALPLVFAADMAIIQLMFSLISEDSDIAVIIGVLLLCTFCLAHYHGIKFLIKKFKK